MDFWVSGAIVIYRSRIGSEKVRTKHAVSDRRDQACEREKLSSVPPHTRNDYIPCLKISGNKGQGSAEIPSKGVARKRAKRASAALATGFRQDFKRTHRYHNLLTVLKIKFGVTSEFRSAIGGSKFPPPSHRSGCRPQGGRATRGGPLNFLVD